MYRLVYVCVCVYMCIYIVCTRARSIASILTRFNIADLIDVYILRQASANVPHERICPVLSSMVERLNNRDYLFILL